MYCKIRRSGSGSDPVFFNPNLSEPDLFETDPSLVLLCGRKIEVEQNIFRSLREEIENLFCLTVGTNKTFSLSSAIYHFAFFFFNWTSRKKMHVNT